jgi:serine/threonine protein kinase
VSGGELFEYVSSTGRFREEVARAYFLQLLEGLNHIHEKGLAHRDLKPENILFSDQFILKIADFGFATLLEGKDGNGLLKTVLGT